MPERILDAREAKFFDIIEEQVLVKAELGFEPWRVETLAVFDLEGSPSWDVEVEALHPSHVLRVQQERVNHPLYRSC